jgi:transaldolase/glucose-6-phosphate isomerase
MNPIHALQDHGQAVWLDFLARGFIAKGLNALVGEGVRGVTSNPAIFEKAIAGSDEYDAAIARILASGDVSVGDLYERLAIEDIQAAADVLRPVYEATGGADGYVSLEVSPYLAMDTAGTVAEARRLWGAVGRKNLMVKVPGTRPDLPAIRTLVAEGININVTLLFAQGIYAEVAEAYLAGLEAFAQTGGDVAKVASVASFFVSRIDSAVDALLDQKIAQANDPAEKARLGALKGKVAIANAKLAYQRYKRLFAGARWEALAARGARPQRLLWASTGTKNKAYSDVLYVEELIGRDTVNTVPPATLDAFRHHGVARDSLEEGVAEAQRVLDDLARAGVSLDRITDKLVEEGVRLFADAADKLLGAVAGKRAALLGHRIGRQAFALGPGLDGPVKEMLEEWRADGTVRLLWRRDATIWTGSDEHKWLGWLDSVAMEMKRVGQYEAFARDVRQAGFTDAVLIGMGGSSLGPEVLARTFGERPGFPTLRILDSTDPAQIRSTEAAIDLKRTLFIVSSKSGSTTEPNVLKAYVFARLAEILGREEAGRRFVAVTDPGSSLEKTAKAEGFWKIFYGEPSIGGRYSVLSPFGLVPAAAAGIDVGALLAAAETMVRSCGPDVPPESNPGVCLGIAMGVAGLCGRDKITLTTSPRLADFGAWAEQLIAESTGKNGKALIPVDGEPLGAPELYGSDRFFIDLRTEGEVDAAHDAALAALEAEHPVVRIVLPSAAQISQEFFRFEIATAVAGAVLGINPFDQPDVEASKAKTRALVAAFAQSGALPAETPVASDGTIDLYTDARNAEALRRAGAESVESFIKAHLARIRPGDYMALLAYVAREPETIAALQRLRLLLRERWHVATCVGFGPRFLHSTGQAYKGGPDTGVVLQITADHDDLPIPGDTSFGIIEAAQARGDFDVLAERGRRALRVHLKGTGLAALEAAVRRALA